MKSAPMTPTLAMMLAVGAMAAGAPRVEEVKPIELPRMRFVPFGGGGARRYPKTALTTAQRKAYRAERRARKAKRKAVAAARRMQRSRR